MKLKVRDAAKLLHVSEKIVLQWISSRGLPSHHINNQYCFNHAEILEWATSKGLFISPVKPDEHGAFPSLSGAMNTGGIHYGIEGSDKAEVIRNIVNILPLPKDEDREFLYQIILSRELLGSTAIGKGIAIPHVRFPIAVHGSSPLIALCFLKKPIDFNAVDRQPVHTLFLIVSPVIKIHLNLLSRLANGLRNSDFADTVARKDNKDNIMRAAQKMDEYFLKQVSVKV